MGDSIFEFGEKFGYESPFGNWLRVDPIIVLKMSKIETTSKTNRRLYIIHFTVASNIDVPSAKLSLLTSNERSSALDLSKNISISKAKKLNEFTISLYERSFNKHSSNSAPEPLLLFLQLEHNLIPTAIVSESFEMRTLEIELSGLKIKWVNSNKKTKSGNDLLTFTFVIRTVNPSSNAVGIRMIQDLGSSIDEFLPERFPENQSKEKPPKIIPLTGEQTYGTIGVYRKIIDERSKKGRQFYIQVYLDDDIKRTRSLDFVKEFSDAPEVSGSCGIEYRYKIYCLSYGKKNPIYGPRYRGNLNLANYSGWTNLITNKKITSSDKDVLVAMSENEGNLDGVQGYDNQIITVGAMQKVISPNGSGEFATQMFEFKKSNPDLFKSLFENCGWTVRVKSNVAYAYYKGVTASALKKAITKGFTIKSKSKQTLCIPIEPLINACKNASFQDKQVHDFISRLDKYLNFTPYGYSYKIKAYINTDLGKGTMLDQSVNRPGHVTRYFAKSLDNLMVIYPSIPENPTTWGANHKEYEQKLLDIYGPLRNELLEYGGRKMKGMTHGVRRYENLKKKLPIK